MSYRKRENARQAALTIDWEIEFPDAIKDVFQFYSAQLQSHAVTATSFALVLLAAAAIKPIPLALVLVWLAVVSGLATAIIYSLLRLFIYGQLSSAILYGEWIDVWNLRDAEVMWEELLPQAQVEHYAQWFFRTVILPTKKLVRLPVRWIVNEKAHPKTRALVASWMIFFAASALFFYWDPIVKFLVAL